MNLSAGKLALGLAATAGAAAFSLNGANGAQRVKGGAAESENLPARLEGIKNLRDAVNQCPLNPLRTKAPMAAPITGEQHGYGVLEDISTGELPAALTAVTSPRQAQLKPNEVEVRVVATSITEHDAQFAEGRFIGRLRMADAGTAEQPYVPGFDFSGVVTNVGDKVKDLAVGQPVIGLALPGKGSWSSHVVTNDALVYAKPDHLSFQEAAASATPFMVVTALLDAATSATPFMLASALAEAVTTGAPFSAVPASLEAAGDLKDKKCLIIGASGNIGSLLLPILASKGADITGVCSAKKADKVRDLGANQVIDYRAGTLTEQLADQKFDFIFDFAGGKDIVAQSKTLKSDQGRLLTTVGPEKHNGKTRLSVPKFALMMNDIAFGVLTNQFTFVAPLSPDGEKIDKNFFQNFRDAAQVGGEIDFNDLDALKTAVKDLGANKQYGRVVMVDYGALAAEDNVTDSKNKPMN